MNLLHPNGIQQKKRGEMIDTGTHFRWIIWLNSTFPWQPCQHIIEHSGQQLTSMYLLQCMLCLTVRNVAIVTVLYIFHFHLPCECCQYKEPDDDKTTPTLWMLSGQTEWWQMFFFCSQPSHLHGVASFSLHSCYSNIGSNRSRVQSEERWT